MASMFALKKSLLPHALLIVLFVFGLTTLATLASLLSCATNATLKRMHWLSTQAASTWLLVIATSSK